MLAAARRRDGSRLAWILVVFALVCGLGAPAVLGARGAKPHLDWRPHFGFANRYIKHRAGTISYGVVGPNGHQDGHRGGRTVPMASTFKVMLLATYLRKARSRPLHHRDKRLLAPMIRRSDNAAATRIRDIVGPHAIKRLAHDAHMHHFQYNQVWGLSRTSAGDQAHFMYRFEHYVPERHRQYARHLLASIVRSQRWGIAKVPLHGWRLHFKGGVGDRERLRRPSGRLPRQARLSGRGCDPDHLRPGSRLREADAPGGGAQASVGVAAAPSALRSGIACGPGYPLRRHSTGTTGFDVVDPCERLQAEVPGGLAKHREKQ